MPMAAVSPFSTRADLAALAGRSLPLRCQPVSGAEELLIHFQIREAIFVHEQGLFRVSDRDARDDASATVHVLGLKGPVAGGTVRLYPLEERGLWKGDRLAVLPEFRASGLGAELVRFAVRTAARHGGRTMIAHVQIPNVRFFQLLGWERVGEPVEYVGRPHQEMAIDLRPRRSRENG